VVVSSLPRKKEGPVEKNKNIALQSGKGTGGKKSKLVGGRMFGENSGKKGRKKTLFEGRGCYQ